MSRNGSKLANLKLRDYDPDKTYVWIHDWRLVPSSHDPSHPGRVHYLVMAAIVKWGDDSLHWAVVTAMQYSDKPGQNVAVGMPPHVLPEDFDGVQDAELQMRQVIDNASKQPNVVPGPQP